MLISALQADSEAIFKSNMQIFYNIFVIFILPVLCGAGIRAVFMKVKKGFAVSVVFAVITVISLLMFMIRSGNGNDGPGLILIMCALAAAASLIAGAIITLIKRKGRQP